jgi:hypothetical protein
VYCCAVRRTRAHAHLFGRFSVYLLCVHFDVVVVVVAEPFVYIYTRLGYYGACGCVVPAHDANGYGQRYYYARGAVRARAQYHFDAFSFFFFFV